MKAESPRHRAMVLVSVLSLLPSALLAAPPDAPEPKVIAAIEPVAGQPRSCIVTVEVRTPDTDQALAAPSFRVMAGQKATSTSSGSAHKVTVAIEAGPDCAGGTYDVKVHANGALVLAKAGPLQAKAK